MTARNAKQIEYFNTYRAMIEQSAWKNARRFAMDVEDVRAQAYFVFCDAFERFDASLGAKFGTFLFLRLRTVVDYCVTETQKTKAMEFIEDFVHPEWHDATEHHQQITGFAQRKTALKRVVACDELIDTRYDDFEMAIDRLESALLLSSDSQDIIDFIIGREWEIPGCGYNRLPRFSFTSKWFRNNYGWSTNRCKNAWDEIKSWWRDTKEVAV